MYKAFLPRFLAVSQVCMGFFVEKTTMAGEGNSALGAGDYYYVPADAVLEYDESEPVALSERTGQEETHVGGEVVRGGGTFTLVPAGTAGIGRLVVNGGGRLVLTNEATFRMSGGDEVVLKGGTFVQAMYAGNVTGVELADAAHILVEDGALFLKGASVGTIYGQVFDSGNPYIRVAGGTATLPVSFQREGEACLEIVGGDVTLRGIGNANRSGVLSACGRILIRGNAAKVKCPWYISCFKSAERTAYPYFFDYRLGADVRPGEAGISPIYYSASETTVAGFFSLMPAGGFQVVYTNRFTLLHKPVGANLTLHTSTNPRTLGFARTPLFDIGIPEEEPHMIRAVLREDAELVNGVFVPGEGGTGGYLPVPPREKGAFDLLVRLALVPKARTLDELVAGLCANDCGKAYRRMDAEGYNVCVLVPGERFERGFAGSKLLFDFTEVDGAVAAKSGRTITNAFVRAVSAQWRPRGLLVSLGGLHKTPDPVILRVAATSAAFEPDGSAEHPFENVFQALAAARVVVDRPVEIVLGDGTHRLRKQLLFSSAERRTSCTALTLRAENLGCAALTLSKRISFSAVSTVADADSLARIPEEGRTRALVAELSDSGIAFPTVSALTNAFQVPVLPEVFVDGRRLVQAGWPDAVDADGNPLPEGEWWAHIAPVDVVEDGLRSGSSEAGSAGVFRYAGTHPERWATAPYICLQGYWFYDWHDELSLAATIDAAAKTITLGKRSAYGMGTPYPAYTWAPPRRWRALNLLEELDRPGECFVDVRARRLYFIPPPGWSPESCITVADAAGPILKFSSASHVVVAGLVLSEGESAAEIEDCTGIVFRRLRIANQRSNAVTITRSRGCRVTGCDFEDIGAKALTLKDSGDRATLSRGDNVVEDCLFDRTGVHRRTYSYAVTMNGVGDTVRRSLVRDTPGGALSAGGNDCVVEGCVVSNCCNTSDDAGAVYRFQDGSRRGNRICGNRFFDCATNGVQGTAAIYFDGGSCGDVVESNLFVRCGAVDTNRVMSGATAFMPDTYGGFGAIFVGGGYQFTFADDVFVDCPRAFSASRLDDARWRQTLEEQWMLLFGEVSITNVPYVTHYPELADFWPGESLARRFNAVERCSIVATPSVLRYGSPFVTNATTRVYGNIRDFPESVLPPAGLITPEPRFP